MELDPDLCLDLLSFIHLNSNFFFILHMLLLCHIVGIEISNFIYVHI